MPAFDGFQGNQDENDVELLEKEIDQMMRAGTARPQAKSGVSLTNLLTGTH